MEINRSITIELFYNSNYATERVSNCKKFLNGQMVSNEYYDADGYLLSCDIIEAKNGNEKFQNQGTKAYSYSDNHRKVKEFIREKISFRNDTITSYNIYNFDAKGLLKECDRYYHSDTLGETESYSYDSLGHLILSVVYQPLLNRRDTTLSLAYYQNGCMYGSFTSGSHAGWEECYDSHNRISSWINNNTSSASYSYLKDGTVEIYSITPDFLSSNSDHYKKVYHFDHKTKQLTKVESFRKDQSGTYINCQTLNYTYDKQTGLLIQVSNGTIFQYGFY